MKIKLKRAAHLGGRDLARGTHDVAEAVGEEPMFILLERDGKIELLDRAQVFAAPEAVEPAPPVDEVPSEDFRDGDEDVADAPEVESVNQGKKKKRR